MLRAMLSALLCSYCVSTPTSGMAMEASAAVRLRSLLCGDYQHLGQELVPGVHRPKGVQQKVLHLSEFSRRHLCGGSMLVLIPFDLKGQS